MASLTFQYTAFTPQGDKVQGHVEADSEDSAEEILWKQNYTIIALKESVALKRAGLLTSRIRTRDLITFSQQLATLIESGISIVRALYLLQEQMKNKHFRKILAEIIIDVQQGRFFSEAILKHDKVFPMLYGRLIEVGEHAGNLEMVLRQLATYLEKEEALVRKVRSALAYPSFVICMAVGVVILMLTVALPPLMGLFSSFDADLPVTTLILMAVSGFFSSYKFQLLIAGVLAIIAFMLFVRTKGGRKTVDGLLLKVPMIGTILIESAVARMCRSMSTLLQAGISLPEILEMVIRTQSNVVLKASLKVVHSELLQGRGLSDPLSQDKLFPGMLVQMARVGEETGALDNNLETLAVFYENKVDREVGAMAAVMEQGLTIFIGLMVGFVAISVITPMYSLMGSIN